MAPLRISKDTRLQHHLMDLPVPDTSASMLHSLKTSLSTFAQGVVSIGGTLLLVALWAAAIYLTAKGVYLLYLWVYYGLKNNSMPRLGWPSWRGSNSGNGSGGLLIRDAKSPSLLLFQQDPEPEYLDEKRSTIASFRGQGQGHTTSPPPLSPPLVDPLSGTASPQPTTDYQTTTTTTPFVFGKNKLGIYLDTTPTKSSHHSSHHSHGGSHSKSSSLSRVLSDGYNEYTFESDGHALTKTQ